MFRTRPESRDSKTVKSRAPARDFTVLEFSRAPGRVRNVLSCKVFQIASLPKAYTHLGTVEAAGFGVLIDTRVCKEWLQCWMSFFIRIEKEAIQTFSELSPEIP